VTTTEPGGLDWLEAEPPLGRASWTAFKRLLRRARASWLIWLVTALVVSGSLTFLKAQAPRLYEASILLRVTEGRVSIPGAQLGPGALRAHLDNIVFTSTHLMDLMRKHPGGFGDIAEDPAGSLEYIRRWLTIAVSENDFNEERSPDDPPRSARLQISFTSLDPDFAFTIAKELSDMVITSTLGRQKELLERERDALALQAGKAESDLAELARGDPMALDFRTRAARDRVAAAKHDLTAATIALDALSEQQALRFEVADPGRVPVRADLLPALLATFFSTLFAMLIGGMLLAGAFDPRVLDVQDLAALNVTVLARLPPLPARSRPDARASDKVRRPG
jgi:hypothetical protein